jgi:hypothetical protein
MQTKTGWQPTILAQPIGKPGQVRVYRAMKRSVYPAPKAAQPAVARQPRVEGECRKLSNSDRLGHQGMQGDGGGVTDLLTASKIF